MNTIRIGYACVNTLLPSSGKTMRLSNASPERILELGRSNLLALNEILRWNIEHNIHLFRICSGIIPFGSHPVNQVAWWKLLAPELELVGQTVRAGQLRVSMHPGQYTVLNSPRAEVVENSLAELDYHARFLHAIGTDASHKIILHGGGVYGDKSASMERFVRNFIRLPQAVRRRLVLENDETSYSLADVLDIAASAKIPVVFDVFHHIWNPSFEEEPLVKQIERASKTWLAADGRQKLHYSDQWHGKPAGSHAASIDIAAFSQFYHHIRTLDLDIMLEVKDKEQSVLDLYRNFPELIPRQSPHRI
jgi:UV DNA damage endonuclease